MIESTIPEGTYTTTLPEREGGYKLVSCSGPIDLYTFKGGNWVYKCSLEEAGDGYQEVYIHERKIKARVGDKEEEIEVIQRSEPEIIGELPPPQDGVLYVVDEHVKRHMEAKGRNDLVSFVELPAFRTTTFESITWAGKEPPASPRSPVPRIVKGFFF